MQTWAMTFVTRTISALRANLLPMGLAKKLCHPMPLRPTGSIDVKFSAASAKAQRQMFGNPSRTSLSRCVIALMATISLVYAIDSDSDGLDDAVETNTGVYVSPSNTGSDPANSDTDDDGVNDGLEVQRQTDPTKVDAAGWTRVATEVHRADLLRTTEGVFHTNNYYSLNGVDWQSISYPPHSFWINASGYGGGTYVLTGAVGQIWTSNDFRTWSTRNPGGEDITDVAYGNGIFVARKFWSTGALWVSSNQGQTWSSADTGSVPDRGSYNQIAFGNGVFVRPGETGVRVSTNGSAWSTITPPNVPAGFTFRGRILYSAHSGFVLAQKVAALNGEIEIITASSSDGRAWSFSSARVATSNTGAIELGGSAGEILFVNAYESGRDLTEVWCSADHGQSWRLVDDGPWGSKINDGAFFCGNSTILAVGTGSEIHTTDLNSFARGLFSNKFTLRLADGMKDGGVQGAGDYLGDSSATLTATPTPGYRFTGWTGDASGTQNPLTILMDANKTVGATFVEDTRDPDNDGLTNYQEIIVRLTNPDVADSDGDGVNDGQEVTDTTNPLIADTDGDGLTDGEEKTRTTNPLVTDTDGDTYGDGYEVQFSSDPKSASSFPTYTLTLTNNGTTTGGTFAKSGTLAHGTNATLTASPLPGYLFGSWSGTASGTSNPTTVLMDANKTVGATFVEDTRDPDADGLTNYQEIIIRLTNPDVADTDNDGVNDGQEVTDATNPLIADTDDDGLKDGEEKTQGTNPLVTDTDGDGYSDRYEVENQSDPKTNESYPTYTLTLTNNGTTTGGTFAKSGTLAHGTNATLTATPLPGYLFGSWSGAASGISNPTNVLMDANKTVGATFVQDTRDPDADGLTNYQEIIIRLTNPDVADTDNDGVNDGQEVTDATNPLVADTDADGLTDGEEKTRTTNPLLVDTDGDGLGDLQEITISQTNPLLSDTNGNGINDALEDSDNDGILNGREVNQLSTNPLLADSNANGLSDTYELLFQGNTDPFTPRVGDRVRYDLSQLGYQGTYKVVGTLPKGLTFNATTGILEGKLIGTASTSKLTIQILNGKTVVRSIPLSIPVLAFPATLAGTWQALLENQQGQPEGLLTVTITSPGTWSASYDGIGTRTIRKAKGSFDLTAAEEEASWSMTFPASSTLQSGLPAVTMSFEIVGKSALAEGTHPRGTMRGFRLARGAELPAKTNTITMLIDQGVQDGFVIPAGMGWATGSISNRGAVAIKGQLGDAQAITTTLSLGATGQALIWLKPYKNLNSYIGGIVSLHGSGVLPASPLHNQESELWWYRAADATELGYSIGFAPMSASVGVRSHFSIY